MLYPLQLELWLVLTPTPMPRTTWITPWPAPAATPPAAVPPARPTRPRVTRLAAARPARVLICASFKAIVRACNSSWSGAGDDLVQGGDVQHADAGHLVVAGGGGVQAVGAANDVGETWHRAGVAERRVDLVVEVVEVERGHAQLVAVRGLEPGPGAQRERRGQAGPAGPFRRGGDVDLRR